MAFKPQCYFASQSNICFSLLHPAPHIPPQCWWQGGQFLMEEAILKGDTGSCHPTLLLDFKWFSAELVYNVWQLSFRIFRLFSMFSLMHQNTGTLPTHFHPSWWMFFSLAWSGHPPFFKKISFLSSEKPTQIIPFLSLVSLSLFLFQESYSSPMRFLGACRHFSTKFWSVQLVLLRGLKTNFPSQVKFTFPLKAQ